MTPEQPFEKFKQLTHFIEQMASSGMVPHGSGWTSFLYELNEVCKLASTPPASQTYPKWVRGDERQPPISDDVPLLINMGDVDSYGVGHFTGENFKDECFGFLHPLDKVLWLDDSEDPAPQVVEEKGIREWTPIAEGLPEANAECWVVIDGPKGSYVTEAHLIKEDHNNTLFTEWRDAEGWNFIFDITHWMLKIRPALPPSSLPLPTDKK